MLTVVPLLIVVRQFSSGTPDHHAITPTVADARRWMQRRKTNFTLRRMPDIGTCCAVYQSRRPQHWRSTATNPFTKLEGCNTLARYSICVQAGRVTCGGDNPLHRGKSILLREGLARILRSANFRSVAPVSCVDRFPKGNHLCEAAPRSEDGQPILVTEDTIGPQPFSRSTQKRFSPGSIRCQASLLTHQA